MRGGRGNRFLRGRARHALAAAPARRRKTRCDRQTRRRRYATKRAAPGTVILGVFIGGNSRSFWRWRFVLRWQRPQFAALLGSPPVWARFPKQRPAECGAAGASGSCLCYLQAFAAAGAGAVYLTGGTAGVGFRREGPRGRHGGRCRRRWRRRCRRRCCCRRRHRRCRRCRSI